MDSENTFTPHINNSPPGKKKGIAQKVEDRLAKKLEERAQKLEKLKKELQPSFEPKPYSKSRNPSLHTGRITNPTSLHTRLMDGRADSISSATRIRKGSKQASRKSSSRRISEYDSSSGIRYPLHSNRPLVQSYLSSLPPPPALPFPSPPPLERVEGSRGVGLVEGNLGGVQSRGCFGEQFRAILSSALSSSATPSLDSTAPTNILSSGREKEKMSTIFRTSTANSPLVCYPGGEPILKIEPLDSARDSEDERILQSLGGAGD